MQVRGRIIIRQLGQLIKDGKGKKERVCSSYSLPNSTLNSLIGHMIEISVAIGRLIRAFELKSGAGVVSP